MKGSSPGIPAHSSQAKHWRQGGVVCLIGLALISVTLACYWPAGRFGFVLVDDPGEVNSNQVVRQGLTWPSLVWGFKSVVTGNWQPLTILSHMVDCQLWGLDAGKHHLTNVFLHTANVLLLFVVLSRMTGSVWRSAFVAALFGWHPMHVESVAWISERKDVLSGLFFLLTLWAYARYVEVAGVRCQVSGVKCQVSGAGKDEERCPKTGVQWRVGIFYAMALGFYALGLMSKPMLVTLPFVLLLLDLWPFRRLAWPRFLAATDASAAESNNPSSPAVPAGRLLWEKLPFFALSAADCIITFIAQRGSGAVVPLGLVPVSLRLENTLTSYAIYLGKLFWPGEMAALYPLPDSIPLWQAAGAGLLLAVISVAVVGRMRKQPWLAVGWLWFIGLLVPVSGLVQVGDQSRADRYTYLPYIGLGLMLAWGLPALLGEWVGSRSGAKPAQSGNQPPATGTADVSGRWRGVLMVAGVAALGACWLGARAQLRYWRDSLMLFQHTVQVTTRNEGARNSLGKALAPSGRLEEAAAQFREALRINPEHSGARFESYNCLGRIYRQQHKLDEAVAMLSAALNINPQSLETRMRLGLLYKEKGETDKALAEFQRAAALAPDDMAVQGRLAQTLMESGKTEEALALCQALVAAKPGDPAPRFMLAGVYISLNRLEEAILSVREGLRRAPNTPAYLDNLARLLATCPEARLRNGGEAIGLAERACKLTRHHDAAFLDTLSAAYAEAGRFLDAIRAAEEARTVALTNKNREGADEAAQKLELYRAGKPYREAPKAD